MARSQNLRGYSPQQIQHYRSKFHVGEAITALNKAVTGEIELTTARMKAIEITLRKTIPDLVNVDLTSGGEKLTFTWGKPEEPPTIIDMTKQDDTEAA